MRFTKAGNLLLGALAAGVLLPLAANAQTCLMMFQMADNNLEYYIRQDYEELSNSPAVRDPNMKTWVYYDAYSGTALPNTVDSNGNGVGGYSGARYITWDSNQGRMRVERDLGEQNSDTPDAITNFLTLAMDDCISSGHDSLMAVFSSHGGGFAGYGGDETKRRRLLQTNAAIAGAVRSALDSVSGAPDKLEVIGFDACLMQAVGAADDYGGVAEYILASEAVEPGHGWSYTYLSDTSSALNLASQILDEFVVRTQGGGHQAPKTMSIVSLDAFRSFIDDFEDFARDLLSAIRGDQSLYSFVSRARSTAVSFEGIVDAVGSQYPSAVDVGSFLNNLQNFCNPGGDVGTSLQTAIVSYQNMMYRQANGPGTAAGTGIHDTWPNQGEYARDPNLWNTVLFNNGNYATSIIPNWNEFLQYFLPSGSPGGGGNSVCGIGSQVTPEQDTEPNKFIKEASGEEDSDGNFAIKTVISPDVSQMVVEYGLDLTTPLGPMLEQKNFAAGPDNYLYLLGGDVAGTYQGSTFTSSWDQQFYFLNITGQSAYEALYVFDQGEGMKKIPALYFPPDKQEAVGDIQFLEYIFFDMKEWEAKGASFAFFQFSVDEADGRVNDNLALYASQANGTFAELPRSAGGFVFPLIYLDAFIQVEVDGELKGGKIDVLPGGFNQTVVEWKEELDYNVLTTPVANIFAQIPSTDAVVVNVYAYNYNAAEDVENPQAEYFDLTRRSGKQPDFSSPIYQEGAVESDIGNDGPIGANAPPSGSAPLSLSACLGLIAGAVLLMVM